MPNQNQENSFDMHEAFEKFIRRVIDVQYFGVSRGTIQLNSLTTNGRCKADRFNVSVPYAGEMLNWTIMFDSNCPEMGPDFEFHNDSFMADPDADMIEKYIPSLANWNPMDSDCLLNVLAELAMCYKHYQLEQLGRTNQPLQAEHEMIAKAPEIRQDGVEVILLPNEDSPKEARFVIRLDMDFTSLPGRNDKADEDDAMLVITFAHSDWSRGTPQLHLTNKLEEIFGGQGAMHLPPYQRNKYLIDYINEVKKLISVKMEAVTSCFEKRRNFVAGMLTLQRHNVVEYDVENFTRICILLEQQDYYFLVHIRLAHGFPKDAPIVNLQSIYHMASKDELCATKYPVIYPYSPRWHPPEMIHKMLAKILAEEVAKFKATCLSAGRRP